MRMNQPSESHHYVRRVVLPSGKTIEVVYFQDLPEDQTPVDHGAADAALDLHVCPTCSSGLVYPTEWEEAGPDHWEVALRCPNCEWSKAGVFPQDIVERFDEELDRGTEALIRDLRRLMHANMEEQIDRFTTALHGDHILPMDF
jgi:hypothetical protein